MNIYSVNMIDVADLRDAINIQYDCRASCMDIKVMKIATAASCLGKIVRKI